MNHNSSCFFASQSRCTLCNAEIEARSLVPNYGRFCLTCLYSLLHTNTHIHILLIPSHARYQFFYKPLNCLLLSLLLYLTSTQLLELQHQLWRMKMIEGYSIMQLFESVAKKLVIMQIPWRDHTGYASNKCLTFLFSYPGNTLLQAYMDIKSSGTYVCSGYGQGKAKGI